MTSPEKNNPVSMWDEDVLASERRQRDAIAATIQFECVKTHWMQTKDGCALKLNISPTDVPPELALAAVGQRFLCVLVAIGHDEQPVKLPKDKRDGDIVQRAGIACQSIDFQEWLVQQGLSLTITHEDAAQAVRDFCGVDSRADLRTNPEAARKFRYLHDCFISGRLP